MTMNEVPFNRIYKELSDLGLTNDEIREKIELAKYRESISEAVYIWKPEALKELHSGFSYDMVFQCRTVDGVKHWFLRE